MRFDIITIFPKIFDSYFSESILKKAQKKKLIKINIHNLRDYTKDKHKTVDDKPYGGGPGMILKVDVIWRAIIALTEIKFKKQKNKKTKKQKIVLLTPTGEQFNQKIAYRYSKLDRLILICGHYEGIDARVEKFVDEKISIGPYVLTGGELPAMIIVDAVTRLIPGVIRPQSLKEETNLKIENCKLKIIEEYPQYTRPEKFLTTNKQKKNWKVPKVLLSGNHKKIIEWKKKNFKKRTKNRSKNS